jgi:hypothetical protein
MHVLCGAAALAYFRTAVSILSPTTDRAPNLHAPSLHAPTRRARGHRTTAQVCQTMGDPTLRTRPVRAAAANNTRSTQGVAAPLLRPLPRCRSWPPLTPIARLSGRDGGTPHGGEWGPAGSPVPRPALAADSRALSATAGTPPRARPARRPHRLAGFPPSAFAPSLPRWRPVRPFRPWRRRRRNISSSRSRAVTSDCRSCETIRCRIAVVKIRRRLVPM